MRERWPPRPLWEPLGTLSAPSPLPPPLPRPCQGASISPCVIKDVACTWAVTRANLLKSSFLRNPTSAGQRSAGRLTLSSVGAQRHHPFLLHPPAQSTLPAVPQGAALGRKWGPHGRVFTSDPWCPVVIHRGFQWCLGHPGLLPNPECVLQFRG